MNTLLLISYSSLPLTVVHLIITPSFLSPSIFFIPLSPSLSLFLPPLSHLLSLSLSVSLPSTPQVRDSMDVFVPVACHPDYFVVQSWQELFKLVVLMGEMILCYNKLEGDEVPVCVGEVYAAKVENK